MHGQIFEREMIILLALKQVGEKTVEHVMLFCHHADSGKAQKG